MLCCFGALVRSILHVFNCSTTKLEVYTFNNNTHCYFLNCLRFSWLRTWLNSCYLVPGTSSHSSLRAHGFLPPPVFSHRPRSARYRVQRRRLSPVACRCATAGARSREVHSATLGNSCTTLRDTSRAARTRRHGGERQTARGHRWVPGFYHTHRRDRSALEPVRFGTGRNGSKT